MIVEPKIRGFICTTSHPVGCARNVEEQIAHVHKSGPVAGGPKKALVIGSSTGYGLASRIAAAFGSGAATLGVFFERPSDGKRTATAGWYNTAAFEKAARAKGLYAQSVNGDAFSDEIKNRVCDILARDLGQVDAVIYSLASPRRTHPKTGVVFKSTLKPIGPAYTNKSFDFDKSEVTSVTLEPATQDDVDNTIGVMGGEDWTMWVDLLKARGLLAPKAVTVAYSYIGPRVTQPIYRNGTIGAAKDDLEKTGPKLDKVLQAAVGGRAFVSVNKALVTQASSAIPFISLYIVLLMKVMKDKGIHEGCIEQVDRMFRTRLYGRPLEAVIVDNESRIRVDDWEMREDVQAEVEQAWAAVTTGNANQFGGVDAYNKEFLRLFGFGLSGVDYSADVDIELKLNGVA